MKLKKKQTLWYVNLGLFGSAAFLAITGLVNWLILPRGSEAGSSAIVSIRHFIRDTHEWCGLLFIILVIIHIYLHKEYVSVNLKKMLKQND